MQLGDTGCCTDHAQGRGGPVASFVETICQCAAECIFHFHTRDECFQKLRACSTHFLRYCQHGRQHHCGTVDDACIAGVIKVPGVAGGAVAQCSRGGIRMFCFPCDSTGASILRQLCYRLYHGTACPRQHHTDAVGNAVTGHTLCFSWDISQRQRTNPVRQRLLDILPVHYCNAHLAPALACISFRNSVCGKFHFFSSLIRKPVRCHSVTV